MKFYIGRKVIGELIGDTLYKEVWESRHLFKKFDAWGVDAKLLHKLPAGTKIVIRDVENNKLYQTTKETYLENEKYYHFKLPGEDYATQLFLPRSMFEQEKPKELTKDQQDENAYLRSQGLQPKYI